nr:hypothetical protein [Paenibacillus sp. Soil787]
MSSNNYNFQKLTPVNNAELKIYKDAFNFVFQEVDIKNVAITGPYSAGKSSVLESYKATQSDKKFLNISLAQFDTSSSELRANDELSRNNAGASGGDINDTILEGKILNQLIHQVNPRNIPQTHFKVKKKVSKSNSLVLFWLQWLSHLCHIFWDLPVGVNL